MHNNKISVAKGLGIFLMVVGHSGGPQLLHDFIYLFHMPLFFFLSGYFLKEADLQNKNAFCMKRVKGLYLPFVKWSLLFLLFHNIFYQLNIYNSSYGFNGIVSSLYSPVDYLKRFVQIVLLMQGEEQLLGGFWFLKQLFVASIGTVFLLFLTGKKSDGSQRKYFAGLILALTVTGGLLAFNLSLPYIGISGNTFFTAAFILSGYLYHRFESYIKYSFLLIIVAAVIVMLGAKVLPLTFWTIDGSTYLYYYLIAIVGTFFTLGVSKFLMSTQISKLLIYLGNNTMIILTLHFLAFKAVSLLKIYHFNLDVKELAYFPVIPQKNEYYWVLYTLVGTFLPLGLQHMYAIAKRNILSRVNGNPMLENRTV